MKEPYLFHIISSSEGIKTPQSEDRPTSVKSSSRPSNLIKHKEQKNKQDPSYKNKSTNKNKFYNNTFLKTVLNNRPLIELYTKSLLNKRPLIGLYTKKKTIISSLKKYVKQRKDQATLL